MPPSLLTDDGTCVTLDLHGFRVEDAMRAVDRILEICSQYGRPKLRIIHGSSSSGKEFGRQTIKEALYDALDDLRYAHVVRDSWREDGSILLALPILDSTNPKRITAFDLGL